MLEGHGQRRRRGRIELEPLGRQLGDERATASDRRLALYLDGDRYMVAGLEEVAVRAPVQRGGLELEAQETVRLRLTRSELVVDLDGL